MTTKLPPSKFCPRPAREGGIREKKKLQHSKIHQQHDSSKEDNGNTLTPHRALHKVVQAHPCFERRSTSATVSGQIIPRIHVKKLCATPSFRTSSQGLTVLENLLQACLHQEHIHTVREQIRQEETSRCEATTFGKCSDLRFATKFCEQTTPA